MQGGDLDGKTLGIIGLGRIGGLVASMAKPFDMTVIAYDPYLTAAEGATRGAHMVGLDDLLRQSDFISMHCPMNAETKGMIDAERLQLVTRGAYFVNLARGGVVANLDCLDAALRDGRLAGAALDVFDPSPPDIAHPLFANPNCLTSPHAIATTQGAMTRIFKSMANDMSAILHGKAPQHVVNPEVLQR